jgi:hypothetical protein
MRLPQERRKVVHYGLEKVVYVVEVYGVIVIDENVSHLCGGSDSVEEYLP